MSVVMVNGYGVIEGRICFPRTGVWHADLIIDAKDPSLFSGEVSVNIGFGALALSGTAKRVDNWIDTIYMRLVAGKAGLSKAASGKFYQSPSLKIPLQDLVSGAGETLSSTADSSVLATQLSTWTTTSAPASYGIQNLIAFGAPNASWRSLPDGSVWVGSESWPTATLDYEVTRRWPHEKRIELGVEAPTLLPAVTLDDMQISYAEHHINADRIRTIAWLE